MAGTLIKSQGGTLPETDTVSAFDSRNLARIGA